MRVLALRIFQTTLSFLLLGSLALSEPRTLTNDEIAGLLPKIIAIGDDTRQTFSAAGATTYQVGGRETYGTWRVDGDKYCSQWPPVRSWTCYLVVTDPTEQTLIWIDGQGHRTANKMIQK